MDEVTRTEVYATTQEKNMVETRKVVIITEYDYAFMRAMRTGMVVCFLAMLVATVLEYLILFGVVP